MITATILSNQDLAVLDIIDISAYSMEKTIEFSGNSSFEVHRAIAVNENDYVILKDGARILCYGIISTIENEDGKNQHTIHFTEIENIFDRDIILEQEKLIKSKGIESFISHCITRNFVASDDVFINKPYIKVNVKSNTKSNVKVEQENGIFNLKTYMANMYERNGIGYTFRFDKNQLVIDIKRVNEQTMKIDTEVSDIANYSEVYETNIIAKLTALWKQSEEEKTTTKNFFLLTDRSISTDVLHPERAKGEIVTEYFEADTYEELYEEVVQRFRSNSYQHSVEADIRKESKLYPLWDLYVGKECVIKTRSHGIKESMITRVSTSSKSQFVSVKFGNLKITLLEKLRKR